MENVAIATIGDVMDLVGENRVFVKKGLELLKTTKNEGLHALMQCTGVDIADLNTYQSDRASMPAEDWIQPSVHWNSLMHRTGERQ